MHGLHGGHAVLQPSNAVWQPSNAVWQPSNLPSKPSKASRHQMGAACLRVCVCVCASGGGYACTGYYWWANKQAKRLPGQCQTGAATGLRISGCGGAATTRLSGQAAGNYCDTGCSEIATLSQRQPAGHMAGRRVGHSQPPAVPHPLHCLYCLRHPVALSPLGTELCSDCNRLCNVVMAVGARLEGFQLEDSHGHGWHWRPA